MFELIETAHHHNEYPRGNIVSNYEPRTIAQPFRPGFVHGIVTGKVTKAFWPLAVKATPPEIGDKILGYLSGESSRASIFLEAPITDVLTIHLDFNDALPIYVDGKALTRREREQLSAECGFTTIRQMHSFVFDQYGYKPINGVLVTWSKP